MALLVNGDRVALEAPELSHERVVSLRDWLAGHWGAVFSHPDDFAPHPSTPCGFIGCLADGIVAAGIKPIVWAASLLEPISSWLDHAFNDDAVVVLNARDRAVVDLSERTLAARLQRLHQRFVLITDEKGRHTTTLTYTLTRDRPRTMLDIVEVIADLRDFGVCRSAIRGEHVEPRSPMPLRFSTSSRPTEAGTKQLADRG